MKKILGVLLLSLATVQGFSAPELKGNPDELRQFLYPQDRIVSIYAQAEKLAYSDKAIVSLVITTEKRKLSDSISANSDLRESIRNRLTAAGIAPDDIKSSKFSTTPEYGWFGKSPDSYKVINRMAISITDESHLKTIAGVSDSDRAIELSGISFEHTQKEAYKIQVKIDALARVMQQKAEYEKALGLKLRPVNFREGPVGFRATRGALALQKAAVASMALESDSMAATGENAVPVENSSFDEIKYEVSIWVDFKIED